jgi:glucosamine--fructose-6-phosphate aminotransferase (isomerizing)
VSAALAAGRDGPIELVERFASAPTVVFTGAGSSYFLAQSVAWTHRSLSGHPALAVPLSELLLRPTGVLATGGRELVVVISRSGATSEALAVARVVRALGRPIVAVTCRRSSPLAAATDAVLVSPLGDEQSIVMTRSFTSMLALLLRVVAQAADRPDVAGDLDRLVSSWHGIAGAVDTAFELATQPWSRVAFLGGGAHLGIANEGWLKLIETSQLAASAHEPLEFRHGPMSIVEPSTLIVGLPFEPGASDEERVFAEMREQGATTWTIASARRDRPDGDSDPRAIRSTVGEGVHPIARLPLLLLPLQAFAFGTACRRGRDPDSPRHLSQVVLLA